MEMIGATFSTDDILQILNDFYNFQSVFDPEVDSGETLTFETTLSEWAGICDLVGYKKLAAYYHTLFQLTTPLADLESLLSQHNSQLSVFCNYLSKHAVRQPISPIIIMGQSCITASIFKTLTKNLKNRGVNIQNLRPGSRFAPLFNKHAVVLLEEVNKLTPGALTKFQYSDNWIVKTDVAMLVLFFFLLIAVPVIWHFHWALFIPLGVGIIITIMGDRYRPAQETIGGYETLRDLISGMHAQIKKASV